jgi:hypothetical protein
VPATGNCSYLEFYPISFTCNRTYSDIGTKWYKINVSDNLNYTDEKTASFSITQDQADLADLKSSKSEIRREGSDSAWFAALFYDTIKGLEIREENVSGKIYITTDGSNYLFNLSLLSQPNGYFNYTFDPNCSFSAGIQHWRIDLNDYCYYTASSGAQDFVVKGQLKNFLVEPEYGSNIMIEVGKTVNITSNITDECGLEIENANVTHEARWPDLSFEKLNVSELGSGIYNSSWNLTFKPGGYYSFRVNSSKQYYYSNSTLFVNWVYLNNTPPVTENLSVTPSSGGWGKTFNFTADVNDLQHDNVTCKLFVYTGQGVWSYKGSSMVEWGVGKCNVACKRFHMPRHKHKLPCQVQIPDRRWNKHFQHFRSFSSGNYEERCCC